MERGAGEILLTSMDRDGTAAGYDLALITAVAEAVNVPVIASGGAGRLEHLAPAIEAGADAVLCASIFHYGQHTVAEAKERMFVRSWPAVGMALLVPIRVLVYALPVSVGMAIAIGLSKGSATRERVMAIVATIVGSLLIGVIAGTTNPRYSYVSLPLLAPLVGVAPSLR